MHVLLGDRMARGPRGNSRLRDTHRVANSHRPQPFGLDDLELSVLEPPRLPINSHVDNAVRSTILEVEDRRLWSPDRRSAIVTPARSTRRWNVPVTLKSPPRALFRARQRTVFPLTPAKKAIHVNAQLGRLSFKQAKHVLVCVRRQDRKEVLHALGKVGKGSSRQRRRNEFSNIRCK